MHKIKTFIFILFFILVSMLLSNCSSIKQSKEDDNFFITGNFISDNNISRWDIIKEFTYDKGKRKIGYDKTTMIKYNNGYVDVWTYDEIDNKDSYSFEMYFYRFDCNRNRYLIIGIATLEKSGFRPSPYNLTNDEDNYSEILPLSNIELIFNKICQQ